MVLEVGTGSGYLTALLAKLSGQVVSIDIYAAFTQQANHNLAQHTIENVTLHTGNAAQGWGSGAAYDAIAITGSLPELPEELKKQLKLY
jgi:protein-L-isoaspartate(D-aspartate) O-methyltransferase